MNIEILALEIDRNKYIENSNGKNKLVNLYYDIELNEWWIYYNVHWDSGVITNRPRVMLLSDWNEILRNINEKNP